MRKGPKGIASLMPVNKTCSGGWRCCKSSQGFLRDLGSSQGQNGGEDDGELHDESYSSDVKMVNVERCGYAVGCLL